MSGRRRRSPSARRGSAGFAAALVRVVAVLVPAGVRASWVREWHAELWHEAERLRAAGGGWPVLRLLRIAWGAVPDAVAMRRHLPSAAASHARGALPYTERSSIMAKQLRFALRTLVRSPGFSVIALVTLALGIGANSALFTIIDAVVLEPLPYAQPDRLVVVRHPVPGVAQGDEWRLSVAGYFHFRENATTLDNLGAYVTTGIAVADEAAPERADAVLATASLLEMLSARTVLGRVYTEEEDTPNGPAVAVLGHDFWQRRYGGDPGVIGRSIEVNGTRREVVGVLASGVHLPDQKMDLWLPLRLNRQAEAVNSHYLLTLARLKPGESLTTAQADLTRMVARFPELYPRAYSPGFMESTRFAVRVGALRDEVIGGISRALWVLLGSVGLVLVIACANVANLFLVRTEARRREVALRSALGASRGVLARMFLTESLALSMTAGALALLLTAVAIRVLLALAPPALPRLSEIGIDGSTIVFTAFVSMLAGLAFGSFPLLRYRQGVTSDALRDGGRGMTASRGRLRVRNALVAGQVALALVLLVAAGLMLESFRRLRSIELGFDGRGALVFDVLLNGARYPDNESVATFFQQLLAGLEQLNGVASAGTTSTLPLDDRPACYALASEVQPNQPGAAEGCIKTAFTGPGYFAAMGIGLSGREFSAADNLNRTGGVVVSRALAERLWPGEDPIGKGIKPFTSQPPFYRVIGVAEDVRVDRIDEPAPELVYFPLVGMASEPSWFLPRGLTVIVRTAGREPTSLTQDVRRVVSSIDPTVPIADVRTLQHVVDRSMVRTSFLMLLLGIAAAIALVLGAVGIYGVVSYVVGQRRPEIGVRMALGARAAQVRGMVLVESFRLAAIGVVAGVVAAFGFTRLLRSLLHEVSPTDPLIFGAVSGLLIAVALLASYVPATRAARVDPIQTLRAE